MLKQPDHLNLQSRLLHLVMLPVPLLYMALGRDMLLVMGPELGLRLALELALPMLLDKLEGMLPVMLLAMGTDMLATLMVRKQLLMVLIPMPKLVLTQQNQLLIRLLGQLLDQLLLLFMVLPVPMPQVMPQVLQPLLFTLLGIPQLLLLLTHRNLPMLLVLLLAPVPVVLDLLLEYQLLDKRLWLIKRITRINRLVWT